MRRTAIVMLLVMALPGVAYAGGGGHVSNCQAFASGAEIAMLDSCFQGVAHFASEGETVSVTNEGNLPHTFTAVDGSFDSGTVAPGGVFELDVDEPGIYEVYCTLHGTTEGTGMAGVLIVGEATLGGAASDAIPTEVSLEAANGEPLPVPVAGGSTGYDLWVPLTAGLAAGLSLAAFLTALRIRRREEMASI